MTRTIARAFAFGAAVVTGMTLVAVSATPAQADTATRASKNVVSISGPATAKVGQKFKIMCQAPSRLVGGSLIVYQNGSIFPVKGVKVGANGACNFRVISGVSGPNKFDVAVKKGGSVYQSNAIRVRVKGNTSIGAANTVKISGPKTVKKWAKINIVCQAPANLVGGKIVIYQNGSIFPVTNVKVGTGGVCNFWVKSGIVGMNKFDLAVQKSGKSYQSNAIKVDVTA